MEGKGHSGLESGYQTEYMNGKARQCFADRLTV